MPTVSPSTSDRGAIPGPDQVAAQLVDDYGVPPELLTLVATGVARRAASSTLRLVEELAPRRTAARIELAVSKQTLGRDDWLEL